jgi:hypothetical protein
VKKIESKLWKAVSFIDAWVHITDKASGQCRTALSHRLPSMDALAALPELEFDRVCCSAFWNAYSTEDGEDEE